MLRREIKLEIDLKNVGSGDGVFFQFLMTAALLKLVSFIHSLICSFIQQIFIGHLLCVGRDLQPAAIRRGPRSPRPQQGSCNWAETGRGGILSSG